MVKKPRQSIMSTLTNMPQKRLTPKFPRKIAKPFGEYAPATKTKSQKVIYVPISVNNIFFL
jgi:hypothetical protein